MILRFIFSIVLLYSSMVYSQQVVTPVTDLLWQNRECQITGTARHFWGRTTALFSGYV